MSYRKALFERTKDYSDNKLCWGPKGTKSPLSNIP
jgi:hypothetical protein